MEGLFDLFGSGSMASVMADGAFVGRHRPEVCSILPRSWGAIDGNPHVSYIWRPWVV